MHPEIPKDHPRFKSETLPGGLVVEYFGALDGNWYVINENNPRKESMHRQDCAAHAASAFFRDAMSTDSQYKRDELQSLAIDWLEWAKDA